jgi:tRNA threonylcarbamoyladenosine biosynthesis protein TsaE
VAEWAAGLVEERGAWVEIVIERPTGAADELDDDVDWSQAPVEPREVSVLGFGERWAEGVL